MSSINKVILIGNLGADPERRASASGNTVCTIRLATTERRKDKGSGEMRESTEWHRIVLFRQLADLASQYLRKGSSVYVEGRLRTRKWQDNDGRERSVMEIEASDLRFIGRRDAARLESVASSLGEDEDPWNTHSAQTQAGGLINLDEIPF